MNRVGLSIAIACLSLLPAVTAAQTPEPPTAPRIRVDGNAVTVIWTPAVTGLEATHFVVTGGTSAGGSDLGIYHVGAMTAVKANLANGTYFVRVIAVNDAGQSAASGETRFVVGGKRPGMVANVRAEVIDQSVWMSWDAPSDGGVPSHYMVMAGSGPGDTDIGAINVGAVTSFTAPIEPGTYYVRVVAVNEAGEGDAGPDTTLAVGPHDVIDGTWQGPTSQSAPIAFTIVNRRVRTLSITGKFNNGSCEISVQVAVKLNVSNSRFTHTRANAPGTIGWTLEGTIATTTSASGTISMTANPSGSFTCSGTVTATWTATNSGVGAPLLPRAPTGFAVNVNDTTPTFNWAPPSGSDPPVASYTLQIGRTSGASDVTVLTIAAPATTSTAQALSSGLYFARLIARNQSGVSPASNEVTFTIADPTTPNPPSGLTASATTTSATLSWSAPSTGPTPSSYDVEIGTSSGGADVGTFTATVTSYVRSLPSGTYFARVRSRNTAGVSQPSNEVTFTINNPLPGAPTGFQGTVSGSMVTFTWSAPSSGTVASYDVEVGTSSGGTQVNIYSTTALTYTAGPAPAGTYYARVRARNASGVGAASNEVSFAIGTTVPGAPSGLQRTVNGSTVTFSWTAPASGGTVASYDVEIGTTSGASNTGTFTTTALTYTSGSLAAATYYARVRARNSAGASAPSNEVSFTIAAALPGAPSGLQRTVSGSTVAFSWSAPSSGGTVASYDVEIGTTSGASNTGTFNTAGLTYTSGSLAGATYYARVRARNAAGTGAASNEVTFLIATAVPGTPTGLQTTLNGSNATLTWSAPTSGGTVASYDLAIGTASGSSNIGVFNTTALTYTSGALASGTYFARVTARNSAGSSGPSNEVTFTVTSTSPPGAPTGLQRTVNGSTVTFAWTAPTTGGTPASYDVEIGTSTGGTSVGIFNVTTTTFNRTLANGTYYARVRARNAAGVSPASSEVNFTISTTGSTVTFAWDAPVDGGASSYDVEIGTSSGMSNIGIYNTTQLTYTASSLASGTYFVRVRSRNANGAGAPCSEIVVTLPLSSSTTTQGQSVVFLP